jgi:predicted dehydrogenase
MTQKIRLGILGIGNMGCTHAGFVKSGKCPDFQITAIADSNPDRLAWAKEQDYGENIAFFDTGEAMLQSGLIDACIIAVPHYDHTYFAMACMDKGIHVMLEKPAGVYTSQVRQMNEYSQKHPDVVFGMMFNQRTNCLYRKLRELVRSGRFGQLRRVNWIITNWYRTQAYYDSGNWRATWSGEGGGVLMNQAPHQLDLLQWICGMPSKVYARMQFGKWHDIEVEDDVTACLEFPNGATGVFVTSTGDVYGTNRLEIQLDTAKLVVEGGKLLLDQWEMSDREFNETNTNPYGKIPHTRTEVETDGENPQHVGVLNAWAKAILGEGELVAHGTEGIHGLTLANAMYLSAFLGQEVQLPLDEALYYQELMKRVKASRRKNNRAVFVNDRGTYGFGSH